MDVRDFLDVKAICEHGSLRKAAAALGVTQPTLSNRVTHFEDQLGTPLFDRSRGPSQPTDLALFIARRAAIMAQEARCLDKEIKRLAAGKAGLVKVGVSAVPARVVLPDIIVSVSERFPDVSLEILTAPTAQLTAGLLQRELDLLVCPVIDEPCDSIQSESLLDTEIIVLANPDHPLVAAPPPTIEGLFAYPIALPSTERRYLDIMKHDYGVDLEALPGHVFCSDPSMLARVVQRSRRLFTAAPRFYFSPELDSGALAVIETPVPFGHSLYLHWNRDAFPLPAVTVMRDIIRGAFANL